MLCTAAGSRQSTVTMRESRILSIVLMPSSLVDSGRGGSTTMLPKLSLLGADDMNRAKATAAWVG